MREGIDMDAGWHLPAYKAANGVAHNRSLLLENKLNFVITRNVFFQLTNRS